MEPFIVASSIVDINDQHEDIFKTTQAESHINRTSQPEFLYLFVNIEENCAVTKIRIEANEDYIIPANQYYVLDDLTTSPPDYHLTDIVFFYNRDLTVRMFNFRFFYENTSKLLKNINVRSAYE